MPDRRENNNNMETFIQQLGSAFLTRSVTFTSTLTAYRLSSFPEKKLKKREAYRVSISFRRTDLKKEGNAAACLHSFPQKRPKKTERHTFLSDSEHQPAQAKDEPQHEKHHGGHQRQRQAGASTGSLQSPRPYHGDTLQHVL